MEIQKETLYLPPRSEHKHTLIWIHGLNESAEKYSHVFQNPIFDNFKIVAPNAPHREVTSSKKKIMPSWFDVKIRNENSFKIPFDEAFSSEEVLDSFSRIIQPLIVQERKLLDSKFLNGKLLISGFSQGCGMSLHSFYVEKSKVDGVIGISGYLFPISPFELSNRPVKIIYGTVDLLRPWEYVKTTYENKIDKTNIVMIEKAGHEINEDVQKAFYEAISQIINKEHLQTDD